MATKSYHIAVFLAFSWGCATHQSAYNRFDGYIPINFAKRSFDRHSSRIWSYCSRSKVGFGVSVVVLRIFHLSIVSSKETFGGSGNLGLYWRMNLCVNSKNAFNVSSGCASGSKNILEWTSAIMCEYCMYCFILEKKVRNSTFTVCITAKFYCEWQCTSTSFSL